MISTTLKDEKVLEFLEKKGTATRPELIESTGISRWYFYGGKGLDNLVENGLLTTNLIYNKEANRQTPHFFLAHEKDKVGLPLFPEGMPIDDGIKKYINELINRNTKSPNLTTELDDCDTQNSSGITVLRYLLLKAVEYDNIYAKSTVKPNYHPSQGYYGRYFGIMADETEKKEEDKVVIEQTL